MGDRLLTVGEVAVLLRVHSATVRRWIGSGELKGKRVGRGLRVWQSDLREYIGKDGSDGGPADGAL